MAPFLPQAQIQAPRNALLDLSPINNAIDGNRRNKLMEAGQQLQEKQFGLQEKRLNLDIETAQRERDTAEARAAAGRVQYVQSLPREQQAAAWQSLLQQPGFRDLPPEMRDFNVAAPQILAKAAQYMDPEKRALLEAQTAQAQAGVANIPLQRELLQAQIEQARRKDEQAEVNARIMRSLFPELGGPAPAGQGVPSSPPQSAPPVTPQGQPSAPGGATLQPMGNPGEAPTDPMLHQAQAASPQQTPQAPPSIVDRLSPAQRQALGLSMMGKGDAGKILLEADKDNRLGQEAKNAVEKDLVAGFNQISRLDSIAQQFRPEFQTWDSRAGFAWNALMDSTSMTRKNLKPEQRQQLAEFSAYKQEATENLNRYIKEITGAQMSEAEAARLTRAMPNPGVGIFDGDSPTEFKAKLDNAIRMSKLAFARNAYLRRQGFTGSVDQAASQIPLQRMEGIIQQRTRAILQEAQQANPGVPARELTPLVRQRLRSEFGISA